MIGPHGLGSLAWKLTFLKGCSALRTRLPSGLPSLSKGRHCIKGKAAEVERTQISNVFCFILAPENFAGAGDGSRPLCEPGASTYMPQEAHDALPSC